MIGITSISIGLVNNTVLRLPDHTREEIELGLVPSSSEFTHLLRAHKAAKFPPQLNETLTAPAIISKEPIVIHMNGSLDEDSDFGIEFVIDTAIPVDVKLFWNLKKEDFNSLIYDKKEIEKEYPKHKHKKVYEPLSSMDGSTELPIELDRNLSSFVHFSHTSSSISLSAKLKQSFILPEDSWVSYNTIKQHIDTNETSEYPLVITVMPDISINSKDYSSILIAIVNFTIIQSSPDSEKELKATITNQYLYNGKSLHLLTDAYGLDEEDCVICLTEPKDTTLLPCNHFCVCHECFSMIETCPICRAKINAFLHFVDDDEDNVDNNNNLCGEAEIEVVE